MSRQSQPLSDGTWVSRGPILVHLATLRKISNDLDYPKISYAENRNYNKSRDVLRGVVY
jgi:hypothetical protein